jgi:hypothetical protein
MSDNSFSIESKTFNYKKIIYNFQFTKQVCPMDVSALIPSLYTPSLPLANPKEEIGRYKT